MKPGTVNDADGKPQAPHILVAIFARGMLLHIRTRIYSEDEPANAADPVMALVPADRRDTLIATIATCQSGLDPAGYHFDIRLQGARETVFFEV